MPRLLVLCRHPHHLRPRDAQAWLRRELEAVLGRDELGAATLTRLGAACPQSPSSFHWLVEIRLDTGRNATAMERGGALGELVADLRLLGMAPTVVLADDCDAVQVRPS